MTNAIIWLHVMWKSGTHLAFCPDSRHGVNSIPELMDNFKNGIEVCHQKFKSTN